MRKRTFIALLAAQAALFAGAADAAKLTTVGITAGIPTTEVNKVGETFFKSEFKFYYNGGTVILSSNEDGSGGMYVDDQVVISVVGKDGQVRQFSHDFSNGCESAYTLEPADLTSLFTQGMNLVKVSLQDVCGTVVQSPSLYLSTH